MGVATEDELLGLLHAFVVGVAFMVVPVPTDDNEHTLSVDSNMCVVLCN